MRGLFGQRALGAGTLFLVACLIIGCGQATAADAQQRLVIGRVWTGVAAQPWAEAVAIDGDRIAFVGSRVDAAAKLQPNAPVIDAGDGLVVPGMIDAHIHLIDGGLHLTSVQLRDAATREEFVKRIAEFAQRERRPGAWITGGDWDHTVWGGEMPDREWIDAVTPETPVWISRLDGHMALANSAAMRAAGVGDDVRDVAGGEIVRDAQGRPTGVFKDNAMSLIDRAAPPTSQGERLEAAVAAMAYLNAQGVTAVHDMGTWRDLEVFRLAHKQGLLNVRVYSCTPLGQWEKLAAEVKRAGRGDEWLQIGGLKGYVDGSLGSHTAAFLAAFNDAPKDSGLLVNTVEDLEEWTAGADRAGLQVAVHAIGDRAIRLQLDVFERVAQRNGDRDRRFRIEHSQHIDPADIPRYGKLGVIASMQPYHAIDDGRWAERVIGARRSETSYAFRSLLDTGGRLAFGSDWYVAPATPLEGIDAAVNRRTLDGKHPDGWVPAQKISPSEALQAYTSGGAYAAFREHDLGTLEAGKLADLVILDRNIVEGNPNEIADARVDLTMAGGRIVYKRKNGENNEARP
ncbi:amidohydrolase [Lacipirellula parvula]|uniref:amidohydrolase n=1 Tax=Lacipirellula parvula TaxID=2650471 RepID=UPI0018E06F2E|nr:amidohydrolase [Lacipirellula parvula]